jgi:hypothetical protein
MLTDSERLALIKDKESPCVDRGEAIVKLAAGGLTQAKIADLTGLSTVTISHLKKCFENLHGNSRQLCLDGKTTAEACYSLARVAQRLQARVVRRAIQICTKRNRQQSDRTVRYTGRQTPEGLITGQDMDEAIKDVKRRPHGNKGRTMTSEYKEYAILARNDGHSIILDPKTYHSDYELLGWENVGLITLTDEERSDGEVVFQIKLTEK